MVIALLLAALVSPAPLPEQVALTPPVLKRACAPDERLFPDWTASPTAAEALDSPDVGLVQVVSVQVRQEFHFAYGGFNNGAFRIRVLQAFRGLRPMESMAIDYSWDWADDRGDEGFLPEAGHVYLYDSYDPMEGDWIDLNSAVCTPFLPAS